MIDDLERSIVRLACEDLVRTRRIIQEFINSGDENTGVEIGRWGASELALHMILTLELTGASFQDIVREIPLPAPEMTWGRSIARHFVLMTYRIPEGRDCPPAARPLTILPTTELDRRLTTAWERLARLATRLAGESRRACWIHHPALGPMSFREWVRFLLIHSLHHRRIARRDGLVSS